MSWATVSSRSCFPWLYRASPSSAAKNIINLISVLTIWWCQQCVNRELPDVQAGFRKGRRTKDQIVNIRWIMEKAREFQKNIYFCFIDYAKAFDCVDHNKLWKTLKEMGIPDHLTCLLRNLYAGQEAGKVVWYSHLFKNFSIVHCDLHNQRL